MDRNKLQRSIDTISQSSLSARRAWIEIVITAMTGQISVVALRKESVDRNARRLALSWAVSGRSPQGERG